MSKRLVLVFVVLACAAAIFAAGQQVGVAGSEFGILRVGWAAPEAGAPGQAGAQDNTPLGRTAAAIVDGQYPASYFPNTELLGADEMRIIALGTGMPNQTKRAVSISYYVELGNGEKFIFDIGSGAMGEPVFPTPRLLEDRQGVRQPPACRPCGRLHGAAYR